MPDSVFSAGGGRGSVEAWFSTALDVEECVASGVDADVHLFVADVIKSFDTVDRDILERVLSSLGLLAWFQHAYFEYHVPVRLRFKLAAGLGEPWTRDGGISQGGPLSIMFTVAWYLPWCRYLHEMPEVTPQLYAENFQVQKEMRNWLISDDGDRWSVKLDVRDLGGHLDATYRSWG